MPSIQQALQWAQTQLHEDAAREAPLLLCHVLQCNRAHLIAWPEKTLTAEQQQQFDQLVARRRRGEPVAYIKEEKEFWSRPFTVNPHCLIPRPETELLIEFVLQHFDRRQNLHVADLGTGSGAIAVTLACECPAWQITATDIDDDALALAQYNAQRHAANNLRFIKSDWFDALTEHYDLIVSNPPYIASHDKHLQQGDVRFEPDIALAAGADGLDAIRRLCGQAEAYLKPGGWLVIEHGYDQKQAVHDLFFDNGFNNIQQLNDYAGNPRLSAGQRP